MAATSWHGQLADGNQPPSVRRALRWEWIHRATLTRQQTARAGAARSVSGALMSVRNGFTSLGLIRCILAREQTPASFVFNSDCIQQRKQQQRRRLAATLLYRL